jgi:hypothetical protein
MLMILALVYTQVHGLSSEPWTTEEGESVFRNQGQRRNEIRDSGGRRKPCYHHEGTKDTTARSMRVSQRFPVKENSIISKKVILPFRTLLSKGPLLHLYFRVGDSDWWVFGVPRWCPP